MVTTLRDYEGKPFVTKMAMGEGRLRTVVKNVTYHMQQTQTHPAADALTFYLLNHITAMIKGKYSPDEPLSDTADVLMSHYHQSGLFIYQRVLSYLLAIITREGRHTKVNVTGSHAHVNKYGELVTQFMRRLKGKCPEEVYHRFQMGCPDVSLGHYVNCYTHLFRNGGFSGDIGGEAWGKIADHVAACVRGEMSPELLVDGVWAMAHNTGSIFNKNTVYSHGGQILTTILDIQRAGQTPEFIKEAPHHSGLDIVTDFHSDLVTLAEDVLGPFDSWVDWWAVEKDGMGTYNYEKGLHKKVTDKEHPKDPSLSPGGGAGEHNPSMNIGPYMNPDEPLVWLTPKMAIKKVEMNDA